MTRYTCVLICTLVITAGCDTQLPAPSFVENRQQDPADSRTPTDTNVVHAEPNSPDAMLANTSDSLQIDASRPENAIAAFLDALRRGDDQQAGQLLTEQARQATASQQLQLSPPGSNTAEYAVGEVEYVTNNMDGAHVDSAWSDVDPNGNRLEYRITWVLRLESRGWRVAGLATSLIDGEPPMFLNFEDPEDFDRKRRTAAAEMARRNQAQQQTVAPDATKLDPTTTQ